MGLFDLEPGFLVVDGSPGGCVAGGFADVVGDGTIGDAQVEGFRCFIFVSDGELLAFFADQLRM